jgi:chromosome segregation ATPase
MEFDEIEKRLNWLDSERQKDRKTVTAFEDAFAVIRDENATLKIKIKTLEAEIKTTKTAAGRVDKVDADISVIKNELLKQILEVDKKIISIESKLEKQRKDDVNQFNKRLLEFQTDVKAVSELKKNLQVRIEEEIRLSQKVDETAKSFSDLKTADVDLLRQQKALANDISLENKRSNDLQIETNALRKRVEEDRNLMDSQQELIRKMDGRINDLLSSEQERKHSQTVFIEKNSLVQVEKENQWKAWQKKFQDMEGLGVNFNTQLLALEETHRSVKRSQREFEEVNERFNRRINEITEMNRLAEERFRQEWVAFKADDQKRWTNYTLTRDEENRNEDRQLTRITDRLVALEDQSQETRDTLHLLNDELQKQFAGYSKLIQEVFESYNQSVGKRIQ